MRYTLVTALAAALLASPAALADEAWNSNTGPVEYTADIDNFAVLSQDHVSEGQRLVFVRDLAGNFDDRLGWFDGYWVSSEPAGKASSVPCPVTILAADGNAYAYWGLIALEFDTPAFPSGFTAMTGVCTDPPTENWTATLQ